MISVVIPMYNSEETILETVESVLNQNINAFIEIIIVNDGSKDRSVEIIENLQKRHYPNRQIKLINKVNGGVSSARNAGLKISSQKWIALLDSDDIWNTNKLQLQMEAVTRRTDILFLGTNFNNLKYSNTIKNEETIFLLSPKKILFKWWPYTSTFFFNRTILDDHNIFFNEKMSHGEDGNFLLQISEITGIYVLNSSTLSAGHGKRTFGQSGLSANLPKMYHGELENLKYVFRNGNLNQLEYLLFYLWLTIKYFRRQLIVRVNS